MAAMAKDRTTGSNPRPSWRSGFWKRPTHARAAVRQPCRPRRRSRRHRPPPVPEPPRPTAVDGRQRSLSRRYATAAPTSRRHRAGADAARAPTDGAAVRDGRRAHGPARRGGRCRCPHRRRGRALVGRRVGGSRLRLRLAAAVEHAHGRAPAPLDPTPLQPVELQPGADGVATGGGFVWIANRDLNTVTRVNAQSRRVEGDPIRVGTEPDSLAEGLGGMWVTNTSDNSVTQLDLGSGKPLGTHAVGAAPEGIVIARAQPGSRTGATGRSRVSTRVATAPPPLPSGAHPFSSPRRPTPCG